MSTDLAQNPKWDEDSTNVRLDHPRHPADAHLLQAAMSAESPVASYLPSKWSWGPAKSSFDW
jgi:hypothetical protein